MNNSIYKKKIAFKQSLPQYKDGGKKLAAVAYGIGKNLPGGIGNMIGSTFANTDAIQENEKLVKSVDLGASTINTIAMGVANPMSLASNVPNTIGKGLDLGSTVAEEKGNTQRAERLDTAAMGMQGVGQIAGMATGMVGQFGGEGGFAQMFGGQGGFNPTQMMGDANIPIMMRNGGMIKRADGSYSQRGLWDNIRANAGSGKKPTPEMLEQERKIKAKYEDGGGLSRSEDYGSKKKPYPNVSSGDFAGGNRSYPIPTKADAVDALKLAGLHGRSDVKSKVYAKYPSLKKEDGGLLQYNNGGPADLIKYNGATHDNSPIDGIPIAANGQQLNSGFSNNIPSNTKALVEDGEYYIKDKNYVITNNDKLKPTKDMSFLNPKKTFAKNLTTIKNKYKGRENDPIVKTSYEREEARLIEANEEMRLAKEAKSNPNPLMMAKNGGKLPKYFDGGTRQTNWWEQLGSGTVDTFSTNQTESMNTMTPSVMLSNNTKNIVPESTIPLNIMKPTSLTSTQNLGPSYPGSEMLFKSDKLPEQNLGKNYKVGQAVDSNVENSGLSMGDKFQLAGLAPATIYNTIQALRPAEKFSPLTSPMFGAGLNDMNQNVRFNTNPILMNRNVGMNQINQGSTSDAVRRANLQSLYRGTNTQLGEMAEREAITNAQLRQQLGQAKIGVGAQDVAAQERARQYNVQAKQAKQQFGATAASQFGQGLTEFGKSSNQGLSNQMGYNTLQNLFSNYKLSGESYSDFLKRLDAGKVQFKNNNK
jgi:hypothetical protein